MNIEELKKGLGNDSGTERGVSWKPKNEGDELAGTIETISYVHTDFGDKYILNIRDDEDEEVLWTLWIDGVVLKNRLLELAPGVGSLIVVVYSGKKPTKSGDRSYNNFQIVVSKPNCHEEWMEAKAAFERKSLLKEEEATGGITAPGDDGQLTPF